MASYEGEGAVSGLVSGGATAAGLGYASIAATSGMAAAGSAGITAALTAAGPLGWGIMVAGALLGFGSGRAKKKEERRKLAIAKYNAGLVRERANREADIISEQAQELGEQQYALNNLNQISVTSRGGLLGTGNDALSITNEVVKYVKDQNKLAYNKKITLLQGEETAQQIMQGAEAEAAANRTASKYSMYNNILNAGANIAMTPMSYANNAKFLQESRSIAAMKPSPTGSFYGDFMLSQSRQSLTPFDTGPMGSMWRMTPPVNKMPPAPPGFKNVLGGKLEKIEE
jgi:hypothetical protein